MPKVPKEFKIIERVEAFVARRNKLNEQATTWAQHKDNWNTCTACELSKGRCKVVLARGAITCSVLFVAEAPGQSEDALGRPFVGNAGKLLDEIIGDALSMARSPHKIKMLFSYLVACIPVDENGRKTHEPSKESIKACAPRIQELVNIAKPKAIVMVGKTAQKHAPISIDYDFEDSLNITHPAALLRLDSSQMPLALQRTAVSLRDLFDRISI